MKSNKKFYGIKLGKTELGLTTEIPDKIIKKLKNENENEKNRRIGKNKN